MRDGDLSDGAPRRLRAYSCGSTVHDTAALVRGAARERRVYPSGVFLYEGLGRRILFDTGYAPAPWRTGLAGALYRRLLPPTLGVGESIAEQIDPASVTHVVLSHLHPDHIGGMRFFPHATFVMARGAIQTLRRPRLRDGLLRGLLPDWFDPATAILVDDFAPGPFGLRTADVFGDPGYQLVDLPGHTRGHLGALVDGRVLLAADAAWGRDMLGQEHGIRLLPRVISHDHGALATTAQSLLNAEAAGLVLLFSHDVHPTGQDLL